MINLAHSRKNLDHWIRLNEGFRSDVWWWHTFLEQWNGVSLLAAHIYRPPDAELYTDASGNWGCGGTDGIHWFQCAWEENWQGVNIATKELVPIILAVGVWGSRWGTRHVLVHSDNMAVVEILKSRTSRDNTIMHLLRCLHFLCAKHDIRISATHIPGVDNIAADSLSRDNLDTFFASSPQAKTQATKIPPGLYELVIQNQPDWQSPDWRQKLNIFSGRA